MEQEYIIKWVTGNEKEELQEIIRKEQHYRRGYHQGYCQAVDDFLKIKTGPRTKLINHCEKLYDWRTEEKTGEKMPPFLQCN